MDTRTACPAQWEAGPWRRTQVEAGLRAPPAVRGRGSACLACTRPGLTPCTCGEERSKKRAPPREHRLPRDLLQP